MDTKLGDLDVIQHAAGLPPYRSLEADAVHTALADVSVKVCSLAHLRAMKTRAARAQDRADLENLPTE